MKKASAPTPRADTVSPIVRIGDIVIFKYEGNIRARIECYEVVEGQVWLDAAALMEFKVPLSQVLGVEKE